MSTYEALLQEPTALAIDRRAIVTAVFITANEARRLDLAAVVREHANRRILI